MDDKIVKNVLDAKYNDMNGVIRGGIDGENEGVETVGLKWVHENFSGARLPNMSNVCSVVYLGRSQALHTRNISIVTLEMEDGSCHLLQPLACQLDVWDRREGWFGGTGIMNKR